MHSWFERIERQLGFTLVEMLVVLTIISLLIAVISVSVIDSTASSRDTQRKADLRNVQQALELYRQENGHYPAGCNGVNWSGQIGTNFACPGGSSEYIVGLAPKYIPVLPTDPNLFGTYSGYVYLTNANGTVYKFIARNTLETEVFSAYGHEFQACDVVLDPLGDVQSGAMVPPATCGSYYDSSLPMEGVRCALATCNLVRSGGSFYRPQDANNECELTNISTSLAVWGGYADPADVAIPGTDDQKVEHGTELVICAMPPVI